MKKSIVTLLFFLMAGCMAGFTAFAEEVPQEDLLKRIQKLEESRSTLPDGWFKSLTSAACWRRRRGMRKSISTIRPRKTPMKAI